MEAFGNFIKVYTVERMLLVSATMANMERLLPADLFIRVNKSFLVAISKIDHIEGNMIIIGKKNIPIGNTYKLTLENLLSKYRSK